MDSSVVTSLGWVCDYALLTDLAKSILVALGVPQPATLRLLPSNHAIEISVYLYLLTPRLV